MLPVLFCTSFSTRQSKYWHNPSVAQQKIKQYRTFVYLQESIWATDEIEKWEEADIFHALQEKS